MLIMPLPKACGRCSRTYQPASGRQRFCPECGPLVGREANRRYMRGWRRKHPEADRVISLRSELRRKMLRDTRAPNGRCGFCQQRNAVTVADRLKILPNGFVPLRIPYCGER